MKSLREAYESIYYNDNDLISEISELCFENFFDSYEESQYFSEELIKQELLEDFILNLSEELNVDVTSYLEEGLPSAALKALLKSPEAAQSLNQAAIVAKAFLKSIKPRPLDDTRRVAGMLRRALPERPVPRSPYEMGPRAPKPAWDGGKTPKTTTAPASKSSKLRPSKEVAPEPAWKGNIVPEKPKLSGSMPKSTSSYKTPAAPEPAWKNGPSSGAKSRLGKGAAGVAGAGIAAAGLSASQKDAGKKRGIQTDVYNTMDPSGKIRSRKVVGPKIVGPKIVGPKIVGSGSFEDAFRKNRELGKKEFEYGGKRYTTDVKEEYLSEKEAYPNEEPAKRPARRRRAGGPSYDEVMAQINAKEQERKQRAAARQPSGAAADPSKQFKPQGKTTIVPSPAQPSAPNYRPGAGRSPQLYSGTTSPVGKVEPVGTRYSQQTGSKPRTGGGALELRPQGGQLKSSTPTPPTPTGPVRPNVGGRGGALVTTRAPKPKFNFEALPTVQPKAERGVTGPATSGSISRFTKPTQPSTPTGPKSGAYRNVGAGTKDTVSTLRQPQAPKTQSPSNPNIASRMPGESTAQLAARRSQATQQRMRSSSSALALRPTGSSSITPTGPKTPAGPKATAAPAVKAGKFAKFGRFAGPVSAALDTALSTADERAKGSGWARSLAKGATVAAGGLLGGTAGAIGGGGLASAATGTAGAMLGAAAAEKAFDTVAGANARERAAMRQANRQRQAGSAIKGIGGKTTFSQAKPGGPAYMSTGVGKQRKTVELSKTGVVQRGGQSTAGYLAFKNGQAVYKAGPSAQSLAKTSSNAFERIGRSLFAGAYKQHDIKKQQQALAKARQAGAKMSQKLGVKYKPGG